MAVFSTKGTQAFCCVIYVYSLGNRGTREGEEAQGHIYSCCVPLAKSLNCPSWAPPCSLRPRPAQVTKVKKMNSERTDLVDDPGAVEVAIFGWLPPAQASRARAGFQGDLQGNVPAHIAGVAEKELLQETPGEAAVERVLQEHGLAPGVRYTFTTSQSHEELHKSDISKLRCRLSLLCEIHIVNRRQRIIR